MGKVFQFSTTVVVVVIVLGAASVATIIALSVVYSQEKLKNAVQPTVQPTEEASTTKPATTTPTPSNEPWDKYRLPDTLKPSKYNVTLWPRLEKDDHGMYIFTGHSTVDFECVKETDLILIHSNKLNLTTFNGRHATLTGLDRAAAPTIKTTWLQETTHYLVIQLNGKLVQGQSYQLYTSFTGELADDLGGFYRSEYYEGSELK